MLVTASLISSYVTWVILKDPSDGLDWTSSKGQALSSIRSISLKVASY